MPSPTFKRCGWIFSPVSDRFWIGTGNEKTYILRHAEKNIHAFLLSISAALTDSKFKHKLQEILVSFGTHNFVILSAWARQGTFWDKWIQFTFSEAHKLTFFNIILPSGLGHRNGLLRSEFLHHSQFLPHMLHALPISNPVIKNPSFVDCFSRTE
jgi:hypothetical protein